jgi:IS605 OrfB family transposase
MVTLTLKLPISTPNLDSLRRTAEQSQGSFNRVCKVGWEMKRLNGVELHKLTYASERETTDLPSQLVCSARVKATEALKSAKTLLRKGKKAVCPQSKSAVIRYDARSANIKLNEGTASLASIDGRIQCSLIVPKCYQNRLNWKVGSSDLVFRKDGRVFLHVSVKSPDIRGLTTGTTVGIDLGVNRPAVSSDCFFFGTRQWKGVDQRYFNLKRALQAKGTKSAKRHLKRLSKKVNRFRTNCDHVVSRRIVDSVEKGTTIILEDLTDIRSRVKARKKQRRRIHSWSFARLKSFVEYKAELKGCFVDYVDPRYTSQKCSLCGHTEKANRKSQSWFVCKSCGFQHNADLNASKNIRLNYLASKGISAAGGHQSTCLS